MCWLFPLMFGCFQDFGLVVFTNTEVILAIPLENHFLPTPFPSIVFKCKGIGFLV